MEVEGQMKKMLVAATCLIRVFTLCCHTAVIQDETFCLYGRVILS